MNSSRAAESRNQMEGLIQAVLDLPKEKQNQPPNAKCFSPSGVLEHMALVEVIYPPMVSATGSWRRAGFIYGRVLDRMRSAKKIGTMGSMSPKAELPAEETAAKWRKARADIEAKLQATPNAVLRHPLFGTMTEDQFWDLLDAHTHYHLVNLNG